MKPILALTFFVLSAGLATAQSWTVTGPQGGSGSGGASCAQTDDARTCTRGGTYTTGGGRIYDWSRTRTATADSVTVATTTHRPRGSKNATWSRNR